MILKIQNFRCHQNCTYEFLDSKINLISGNSGVGKTTILKAIKWCLFGKIKSVQNKTELQLNPTAKPKCAVTMIMDQFTITRSKNPENLLLVKDGVQYDSEVAQSQINAIFSEQKIWETCCCLDQGLLNSLIMGSEKDKIDFLESLSFQQESPEVLIGKIEKAVTKTEADFQNLQVVYYTEQKMYTEFIKIHGTNINPGYLLDPEKHQTFSAEITTLENNLKITENELKEYTKNVTILETYTLQKDEIQKKLSEVSYINLDIKNTELKSLEQKIIESKNFLEQYTSEIGRLQEIENLRSKLSEIPEILDSQELEKQINLANCEMVNSRDTYNTLKQKEFIFLELEKYQLLISQIRRLPNLSELENTVRSLEVLKLQHAQKVQLQEYLQKLEIQKAEIQDQLSKVPAFDLDQFSAKLQEFTEFMKYESQGVQNNKITEQIKIIEHKLPPKSIYPKFSETEVKSLELETEIYQRNMILSAELGVEYAQNIIDNEINSIKYQLMIQPELQKIQKYQILRLEYEQIVVENIDKEQILSLQKEIQLMVASNDVLQCPHCKNYLKLYQQKLINSEQKAYTEDEIRVAKLKLGELEAQYILSEKKIKLFTEMQSLGTLQNLDLKQLLNSQAIESKYSRLSKLQNIKVIPAPKFDILQIQESQKYYQLYEEIEILRSKIIPDIPTIDWLQYRAQYQKLVLEYENAKKWIEFSTTLKSNLQLIQQKISEVVIPELASFDLQEYQKLTSDLQIYKVEEQKYDELSKIITNLKSNYNLDPAIDIKKEILELEDKITLLTQKIHTWTNTKESMTKYQTQRTLYLHKLSELEKVKYMYNISLIGTDIETIKNMEIEYSKLSQEITSATISNNIWNTYNTQLLELQHKISELCIDRNIPKKLEDTKFNLQNLKLALERHNITSEYSKKVELLDIAKNKCLQTQTRFTDLLELKKIAIQTSRECLENTVSQINNDLYHICSNIFDNNIEVLLSLYKQLKSDKEKESVNIFILNKGIKYDFTELSGGQKARLSLALTIALSMISTSPILLLDEVFNSIDAEAREQCFKIIKYYTQKTVIMISHMENKGFYDNIIEL